MRFYVVFCFACSVLCVCDAQTAVINLMTYNIRHGLTGAADWSGPIADRQTLIADNLPLQAAFIKAQEVDIVALQEVDNGTVRTGGQDQTRLVGQMAGLTNARYAAFPNLSGDLSELAGGDYGLSIISRFPMQRSEILPLPDGLTEGRVALLYEIDTAVGPVRFVNVHFDWHDDSAGRVRQSHALVRQLDDAEVPYVVTGDFNAELEGSGPLVWDDGRAMRSFVRAGFRCLRKRGAQRLTWNAIAPSMEIDHVCVRGSKRIRIDGEARVLDEAELSDHRAVVARLELQVLVDPSGQWSTTWLADLLYAMGLDAR